MSTVEEVAAWMMAELRRREPGLDQAYAAHNIQLEFGSQFIRLNKNGNLAIDRDVLAAFKKLSGDAVVWDRTYRRWRLWDQSDGPGRQQQ